ncbi:hypothetical protein BBP40_003840, partial [Aspergillus hancockii]
MASAGEITKRNPERIIPIPAAKKGPDDWSGLTDAKERRRRQNRINQQAYRQRKRAERQGTTIKTESSSASTTTSPPTTISTTLTTAPQKCPSADQTAHLLTLFSKTAYESYIHGSPTSDHLLTLSKVNVFRAFATIMSTLGMTPHSSWMHDDALSPFTTLLP